MTSTLSVLLTIVLAAIFGLVAVNGQTQCQCGAYIKNAAGTYSEWFYSFRVMFYDTCNNLELCKEDCLKLGTYDTNDGDISKNIPGTNTSFGDFACARIGRDIPKGYHIAIEYQLCTSPWYDTGLVTTEPFCCINGDFPENGQC